MDIKPEEVRQKVLDILLSRCKPAKDKEITDDTKFVEDIGMDSLDQVEFILELEDVFKQSIPTEDSEKITTFGEAVKLIEGLIVDKSKA